MIKFDKIICAIICITLSFGMVANVSSKEQGSSVQSLRTTSDKYMEKVLSDYHIVGASVAIVKDGEVLFKKGYGYADLENKIPTDADTTSFQIASVSKVFTATAVMQMVETGKLSLDEDVNNYLTAFKVNNPFSTPVTLRTLLTHTSGIDFQIPLLVPSSGDTLFQSMETLENNLKKNLPPVIREPGTFCQYNGYGIALAGYLVEIASGKPLDQYITENILKPLEMKHSSYGITKSILPSMAKPYISLFGRYIKRDYTLLGNHPAGSLCASASDMANFMLAHLNEGEFNGKRILNSDTAIKMHTHQYPTDSRLVGFSLGFYEAIRNGYNTIEFGGHLPCYSSKMSILPEEDIGIFIAINTDSANSGKVCNEYIDMIYKLVTDGYPEDKANIAALPLDIDADKISGRYSLSEYGNNDFTKMKSVMITCKVKCDNNGKLKFSSSEINWNFYYVGNGVFYCENSKNYCKFSEIDGKQVMNILGFDYFKINSVTWLLFIISLISQPVFVVFILILLISLIKNRKRETGFIRAIKIIFMLNLALVILFFLLNALISLQYMIGDTAVVFHMIQPAIPIVCWICTSVTIISTVFVFFIWLKTKMSFKIKITLSVLTILSISNVVFMYLMNGMKF